MSDRTAVVNLWPTDWIRPQKHAAVHVSYPFGFRGRAAASHPLVQGSSQPVSETTSWPYVKTLGTCCLKIQFYFRRGKKIEDAILEWLNETRTHNSLIFLPPPAGGVVEIFVKNETKQKKST